MYTQAPNHSAARKTVDDLPAADEHPQRHLYALPELKNPTLQKRPDVANIPPPDTQIIQKIAIYGYEVLDGSRAVAQLGSWITRDVAEQLRSIRAARTERRTLYRDHRRRVPVPGRVHLSQVSSRVAEATVVLQTEARSTAVAIRMEFFHQRWRVTVLAVL